MKISNFQLEDYIWNLKKNVESTTQVIVVFTEDLFISCFFKLWKNVLS